MRARDIAGKTVARVDQENHRDPEYPDGVWIIQRIWFTDGSCVYFDTTPTEDVPAVTAHYAKPKKTF